GEDCYLWFFESERDRKVNRVLADISLVFKSGRDIDRAVRHDQYLVISRNIHHKNVTYTTLCTKSPSFRDNRSHQFVSMQAAFHQEFGFALTDQFDSLCCRQVAVLNVHDLQIAQVNVC